MLPGADRIRGDFRAPRKYSFGLLRVMRCAGYADCKAAWRGMDRPGVRGSIGKRGESDRLKMMTATHVARLGFGAKCTFEVVAELNLCAVAQFWKTGGERQLIAGWMGRENEGAAARDIDLH